MEGFAIKQPRRISIQDIAGELHSLLVSMRIGFCRDYAHERSRFDFVIVNRYTNRAIALFEIRSLCNDKPVRGKRIAKYGQYDVPLFCISNIKSIRRVMMDFFSYLQKDLSVTDAKIAEYKYVLDRHIPNEYVFGEIKL